MNLTDKITITQEDNMLLMARYPDNYFDLAIVDPPYGIIFCYFIEAIKPLKLNSTNNKILAGFAKKNGLIGKECHVIENWKGMLIELYVDRNVKMMGAITDGVRIRPIQPTINKVLPNFTETNFEAAKKANATIEQIKTKYTVTKEIEKKYGEYCTTK
jgi:DNA modification methylase